MAKVKPLSTYVKKQTDRCLRMFGQDYVDRNEEIIERAAKEKRLLDIFDEKITSDTLTVVSTGSQGQMKEDINPIIKHRNDVDKLYGDSLDALQLTERSRYKKTESNSLGTEDKMADFFNSLNK